MRPLSPQDSSSNMKTKTITAYSVLLAILLVAFAFCALNVDAEGETSGQRGEIRITENNIQQ